MADEKPETKEEQPKTEEKKERVAETESKADQPEENTAKKESKEEKSEKKADSDNVDTPKDKKPEHIEELEYNIYKKVKSIQFSIFSSLLLIRSVNVFNG